MKKTTLALVAMAVCCIGPPGCGLTQPDANQAANTIVQVSPLACKLAEDIAPDSPLVELICDVLDPKSGAKVGEQSVRMPAGQWAAMKRAAERGG